MSCFGEKYKFEWSNVDVTNQICAPHEHVMTFIVNVRCRYQTALHVPWQQDISPFPNGVAFEITNWLTHSDVASFPGQSQIYLAAVESI